jgi:hypothetical protein
MTKWDMFIHFPWQTMRLCKERHRMESERLVFLNQQLDRATESVCRNVPLPGLGSSNQNRNENVLTPKLRYR